MSETAQDDRYRGEYRCLTAAEIGGHVAFVRKEVLGWKQLALAVEAGVTERTVQRVERGERVSDETLQKIALGLRLPENAFVGPRYVPTVQEAAEKAAKALTEVFQARKLVDVQPVTQANDVDQILGAQVWLIDDDAVTEPACELAASLKEVVRDWGDLYSGLSPLERRKACLGVLETIQEIEGRGYPLLPIARSNV